MAIETGKDATFALLLFKLFKSMAEREGRTRLRSTRLEGKREATASNTYRHKNN